MYVHIEEENSAIQSCVIQYSAVHYRAVQYNTMPRNTVQSENIFNVVHMNSIDHRKTFRAEQNRVEQQNSAAYSTSQKSALL